MFLLLCLLKNVEIVIIKTNKQERLLRQKVLKALANPARIFYVPYSLAILNFFVWFMVFIVSMIVFLLFTGDIPYSLPLVFLGVLVLFHSILGVYAKQDYQIAQILLSSFQIFKRKIPKRLVS